MSCRPMTPYACACVYVLRWETAALVVSIGASQGEPMQVSLARACVVKPYCRSVMQQHDNGRHGNGISRWGMNVGLYEKMKFFSSLSLL